MLTLLVTTHATAALLQQRRSGPLCVETLTHARSQAFPGATLLNAAKDKPTYRRTRRKVEPPSATPAWLHLLRPRTPEFSETQLSGRWEVFLEDFESPSEEDLEEAAGAAASQGGGKAARDFRRLVSLLQEKGLGPRSRLLLLTLRPDRRASLEAAPGSALNVSFEGIWSLRGRLWREPVLEVELHFPAETPGAVFVFSFPVQRSAWHARGPFPLRRREAEGPPPGGPVLGLGWVALTVLPFAPWRGARIAKAFARPKTAPPMVDPLLLKTPPSFWKRRVYDGAEADFVEKK